MAEATKRRRYIDRTRSLMTIEEAQAKAEDTAIEEAELVEALKEAEAEMNRPPLITAKEARRLLDLALEESLPLADGVAENWLQDLARRIQQSISLYSSWAFMPRPMHLVPRVQVKARELATQAVKELGYTVEQSSDGVHWIVKW